VHAADAARSGRLPGWARDLGDKGFIKVSARKRCCTWVMRLFVKVIPLRAGTSEPAGEPRLVRCPRDVEPDTVLSFLTQQLVQARRQ
jgi:hypothetical protein